MKKQKNTRGRFTRTFLVAAALMAAATFHSGAVRAEEANEVKIDNFTFEPAKLTVKAGTTVTWINQDDIPHNVVTSATKTFRSKVMDTDDKYSFTFTTPGTYDYFCALHPQMRGTIVVEDKVGSNDAK